MKKALTHGKVNLQFWQQSATNHCHYIGNRHMLIRVQEVPAKLRATLAGLNMFEPNTTSSGITCPNVEKIMHLNDDKPLQIQQLIDTKFTTTFAKHVFRVFVNQVTNEFVFANDVYITEIEAFFNYDAGSWATDPGKNSPLIYGNHLGLVMPFAIPSGVSELAERIEFID